MSSMAVWKLGQETHSPGGGTKRPVPLRVACEVLRRVVERLMGDGLAQDHELPEGAVPAQVWLPRCSG
jgi:hypothetical protein